MTDKLLIYTPKMTNRLGYTLNVVFRYILKMEYQLTVSREAMEQYEGPKISYGHERIGDSLFIKAARLLTETTISEQELRPLTYDGQRAFFPVYGGESDFPFDPLASSFYLLSRYEEYLPHLTDEHGRFKAVESVQYKEGMLAYPMVDRWALAIRDKIAQKYPSMKIAERKYEFVQTVDIDSAYCYKNKGIGRGLMGLMRDISARDTAAVKRRMRVITGKEKDPYDTFEYILEQRKKYRQGHLIFFVLLGDYGVYDKPISYLSSEFRELLKHVGDYAKMGIHPSYESLAHPQLIDKEMKRLSDIIHRPIVRSRFHFLRLQLPESYRALIHAGIKHDYTMGYAEEPGYRAGTATPYPFFDLLRDSETELLIHPFVTMDTTFRRYKEKTPDEAIEELGKMIEEARKVGGRFCCIVHNQNIGDIDGWGEWKRVYEAMMEMADPSRK
jgi:hypothetical protein